MKEYLQIYVLLLTALFLSVCIADGNAQGVPRIQRPGSTTGQPAVRYDSQGRVIPGTPTTQGQDSLKHRDNTDDSITIYYRYFDSTRIRQIDSSINDFTTRYPVPAQYVTLGNFGAAAHSLIFNPILRPGFDAGFHAFDIYRFTIEDTRFYQTTRPYTQLGYLLGSKGEQMINLVHTQNIKPNFNMALQYRLINSPGNLQNQNTNHNSYRINGNYQSRNKRYSVYGIFLSNKIQNSETGGIQYDSLLNNYSFSDRFNLPTRLSPNGGSLSRNPFNTRVSTGNVYGEQIFMLRQQYDFGQSDSLIVNDSTVIRLFYPRFRLQHTFNLTSQDYEFRDFSTSASRNEDYLRFFNYKAPTGDFSFNDRWKSINNDFSIVSFPEKNNLNQFIKTGAAYEMLAGTFGLNNRKYNNLYFNGEYRNRTRNQKWDLEAIGKFYLAGLNSGDYSAQASLKRLISQKIGYLELGFLNVNRNPSFVFSRQTNFPVNLTTDFKKENLTRVSASLTNGKGFELGGEYYLVSNYSYFDSFFTARQEGTLFNILHLSAKKRFQLTKALSLYSEVHLQQASGNPPVNVPLFFTSNRIAFEGVYAKNMLYSIGLELRYHSPYKANNYSPLVGQFFYQNSYTINNRPEINAYFNFRIKRFYAFVRLENLNTFAKNTGDFGFNKNNLSAEHYPQQGMWFRIGIWWNFIN
jgi:hypothetical protein